MDKITVEYYNKYLNSVNELAAKDAEIVELRNDVMYLNIRLEDRYKEISRLRAALKEIANNNYGRSLQSAEYEKFIKDTAKQALKE